MLMANQLTKTSYKQGQFQKGQSGNPAGRPRGSSSHAADLRRTEKDALELATNATNVIAETARLALVEVEHPELIPLFDAISDAAKDAVKDGEIGPSSVALLRGWFDNHQKYDPKGDFFAHVGLPKNSDWSVFVDHYKTRGRIDHRRHSDDLRSFSPIVQRIEELMAQTPDGSCSRSTLE